MTIGNSAFTGVSEFAIYDGFNYSINKYNIFTWLSESIYDREADGQITDTYSFIKNVVVTILDDETSEVKFKFFIPFRDKFDIFSISHAVFKNNRLDLGLLDSQFQRIRDFESKNKKVVDTNVENEKDLLASGVEIGKNNSQLKIRVKKDPKLEEEKYKKLHYMDSLNKHILKKTKA